jgi:hypothetical protein
LTIKKQCQETGKNAPQPFDLILMRTSLERRRPRREPQIILKTDERSIHLEVCIARAQAERLVDVSFGLLGATGENLGETDLFMGGAQISIQGQRLLAFGNALSSTIGIDLNFA